MVAAAGLAGATAGSLIAGLALRFEGPRVLVLVAAGTFALAACVPAFSRDEVVPVPPTDEDVRPGFREIGRDPYTAISTSRRRP